MRIALWIVSGLLCLQMTPPVSAQKDSAIHFRSAKINGSDYTYEVYAPPNWTRARKWSVILFLHGAGERGDYPPGPPESVIARFFVSYQEKIPAVVVFPRCAAGKVWSDADMEALALQSLEQTIEEWNGDRNRLYLTGLSMGGFGTWHLAGKYPEKFAAIAPVCGGIRPPASFPQLGLSQDANPFPEHAARVRHLPIWIFHGADDPIIPVEESRKMFAALQALGADVRYSEYPGVKHDSWNNAYKEPEFMPWLLAHRKKNSRSKK